MEIGDIFNINDYSKYVKFCNENNLQIVELEPSDEGNRVFQVQELPKPTQKEINEQEISNLKRKLEDTDYIANKLAEATAKYYISGDKTELNQLIEKYSSIITERQSWRERVDELEKFS